MENIIVSGDVKVDTTRLLGKGAVGEVYMGADTKNKRLVAVKILPARRSRHAAITKEVLALKHVAHHSNILELWQAIIVEEQNMYLLVTEFCDLGDLEKFYKSDRKPGPNTRIELMHQISEGVAYMHGLEPKIMHRDLKPANVLISHMNSDRPVVKIADFGVAKIQEYGTGETQAEMFGQTKVGTELFLAPEIVEKKPYTVSVDIFSMGLLFVAMMDFEKTNSLLPTYSETKFGHHMSFAEVLITTTVVGMEVPKLVQHWDGEPRCFREVKKFVHSMTDLDPAKRLRAREVELELRKVFDNVKDDLEPAPAKKPIKLPVSLKDDVSFSSPKAAQDDSEDVGYTLVNELLKQKVRTHLLNRSHAGKRPDSSEEDLEKELRQMPLLAALEQWQDREFHYTKKLKRGTKVRCAERPLEEIIRMQKGYGGWSSSMKKFIGKTGFFEKYMLHIARVQYETGDTWGWNPRLLETTEGPLASENSTLSRRRTDSRFKRLDIVLIEKSKRRAIELQRHHGGYHKHMELCLGLRGVVNYTDEDGDVKVTTVVDRKPWVWNPELLQKVDTSDDVIHSGDVVVVIDDIGEMKHLQREAGGWIDEMATARAEVGVVRRRLEGPARLLVEVVGTTFFFHPSAVRLLSRADEVVQALLKRKELE